MGTLRGEQSTYTMDGDKPSDSIVVPKATKSTIIAMPTTPVSSQDLPTTKTISTIKTRTSSAHSNANSSRNMTQSVTDGSTDNNATIIPPTINGNEASSFETIIGTNNNNHSTDVAASANTVTASESDTNTIAEPIASGTDISQLPSFSAAVSTPIEDIAPSSTTITDSAIIVPTTPEENTFRTSEPPLSNNNSHTTVTTPTNVVPNTISSTAATNTIASSIEAQATDNTTPKSTNILVATLSHNTIMHSTSTSPPSSSSTNASISLSNWFLNTFRLDDTQLLVRSPISISHEICAGLPALITRSNTIPSNKNCPDTLSTLNASCTCLTGYNPKATTSVIHVTSNVPSRTQNWTQTLTSPLPITALRPLHLSSSTKTLVLQGVDASYASITFLPERTRSNSSRPLVHQAKNLTTLALYNVDLHSIALESSNFIPSTVTNLTLRHCNLTTLPLSFTSTWTAVQHLDLSQNHLHSAYTGGPALKTLNLSYNSLVTFPTDWIESSPLQALYLQGNALQDLNITHTIYKRIQALRAFQADPPPVSSTCPLGAWQAVHGVTFCVLHASTAAVPDTSASSGSSPPESSTSFGVLSYWLLAGTLAVFLMLLFFVYQRRRKYFERASSPMLSPVEPMTPRIHAGTVFRDALNHDTVVPVVHGAVYHDYGRSNTSSTVSDETYATVGASLYHSSILAACRLDYDEVALGRCISRGGFGLVFVGCYRGRQVAVKKIRNDRSVGRDQVEQFVNEITLLAGLQHPRIVEFIGACWTTPLELSAVTELMERGDLRDVTRRFKRRGYALTWATYKTAIALQIAEALMYLHGLSPTVIHRDLKSKNVLLNAEMEAKLSDFGIARERSKYDGSEHMTVGIGTSFWMAPEVLIGRDYDERADIYSFGVVLSEIDTDDYPYWNSEHPPQGKAQENEILRLVARGSKRPGFSEDCPSTILELATRCLRADPEERPRASEIVVYLQNLIRARPSQSFESSAISSIVTVVPQPVSSRISGHSPITTSTVNQASWNATSSSTVQSNQALLSTHEMVAISPQVTRQVLRTTLPYKHKRTTRNTTRREESYSTNQNTGTHASTTEGANRVRPFRLERNRTVTRRNDGECNPTSPSY